MRFLKIKRVSTLRTDGSEMKTPLIIDTPRRFAKSHERKETCIKRTKCQLITGAHDSGKTRWLERLYDDWEPIWKSKIKSKPVYISALDPVSDWIDVSHVAKWFDTQEREAAEQAEQEIRNWRKLSQKQCISETARYLHETGTLLFLDDAHKLTGRKLQFARQLMMSTRIWLMTTYAENRLSPSLRTLVERASPQRTELDSDASYDATRIMLWLMIAGFTVSGAWEAALILGGLQMLGAGRNAAKPD